MRAVFTFSLALLVVVGALMNLANAAATPEQQAKATAANDALKKAGLLIVGKKFEEAAPLVVEAQKAVVELLGGNEEGKKLAAPLEARLDAFRRQLEKQNVTLPPFEKPSSKAATPGKPVPPGKPAAPAAGDISFTKQVAPILVARCNNCHITAMRGNFSMASYTALMKGNNDGKVILAKADGSRLIEVLASGDMPRGGGKLANDQIETIAKWIDQGAKYDGADPNSPITTGVAAAPQQPKLAVVQASGSETIKYARDIAPILAATCTDCHDDNRPQARLGLDTFTRLLAGSENGAIIVPGKPAESEIIKRLKGEGRERMPRGKPALSADVIAKFEKWIAEGAKFDGSNPNETPDMVARIYKASIMSHEELAAERASLAAKNWKLSNPDDQPDKVETDNFILLGNVGEDFLAQIGKQAETQQSKVAKLLHGPASGPLVKGRVTLFVFNKRYDYSEHGKMVEKREIPSNWQGHWKYNVVDAYACLVVPMNDPSSAGGLVAEQLAGTYIDALGKVPQWFAQGSAWAVGAAAEPKDPRSRQWEESVPAILSRCAKSDDFLTGALPPADTAVLNYSFCKYLMSDSKKYTMLLNEVKAKKDFNQALMTAYKTDVKSLTAAWAPRAATAKRGK